MGVPDWSFVAGSAVLQGAICGLASMFPHNYMQGTFSGMVCIHCKSVLAYKS